MNGAKNKFRCLSQAIPERFTRALDNHKIHIAQLIGLSARQRAKKIDSLCLIRNKSPIYFLNQFLRFAGLHLGYRQIVQPIIGVARTQVNDTVFPLSVTTVNVGGWEDHRFGGYRGCKTAREHRFVSDRPSQVAVHLSDGSHCADADQCQCSSRATALCPLMRLRIESLYGLKTAAM